MPITQFTAHTGEVISGERLTQALDKVASDWERLAHAIYKENAYAAHVPERRKLENRDVMLADAAAIRAGHVHSFTIAQRVNTELTGVCVALLA